MRPARGTPEKPAPEEKKSTRPVAACPICGAPASARSWPFCSARCADVVSGAYAIPVAASGESAEESPGEDGSDEGASGR
jgi:endogenous inhibitor of DNA gyrase (YacG/DUF329 family)